MTCMICGKTIGTDQNSHGLCDEHKGEWLKQQKAKIDARRAAA